MRRLFWVLPIFLLTLRGSGQSPDSKNSMAGLPEFHRIYAISQTIYLKDEQLRGALARDCRHAVSLVAVPEEADLLVEVHRPFLTFDWTYKLVQRPDSNVLATGKVAALDGAAAAPRLAASICAALFPRPGTLAGKNLHWRAKYFSGSLPLPSNTSVQLAIAGDALHVRPHGPAQLAISAPLSSVWVFTFGLQNQPPRSASEQWWSFWSSPQASRAPLGEKFGYAISGDEAVFLTTAMSPFVVGVGEFLKIFEVDVRVLKLRWEEGGVIQEGEFQMSAKDAAALLQHLSSAHRAVAATEVTQ